MLARLALFISLAGVANGSPDNCAPCHRAQTRAFSGSGMTRALESTTQAAILRANPTMKAEIGGFSYAISTSADESIYSVSDGKETIRIPIRWAFGQGTAGQTYLYDRDGRWYESRVSYFSAMRGLGLTMGAQSTIPSNLLEAAGRLTSPVEAGQCFDCHATNVLKSPQPVLTAMVAGVQCERCHGATESHLSARKTPMRKLGKFSTEETSDFCGQCHRTWAQVADAGPRGIQNVRFQPYRLGNSKCYDATDSRIRCTACHNPHEPLETSATAYDAKCVTCHARGAKPVTKASAHICRVATTGCNNCHMPRLHLPGANKKFADHRIRVVKANEQYPD